MWCLVHGLASYLIHKVKLQFVIFVLFGENIYCKDMSGMCCTCQSTKHYPVCVAAMHCHFILIFLTYYDGDDEEDIDNGDNGVCVGKPKKK